MNVTVINARDLLKYTIGLVFILFILVMGSKFFIKDKNKEIATNVEANAQSLLDKITNTSFLSCFDVALPILKTDRVEEEHIIGKDNIGIKGFLNVGLGMIDNIKKEELQAVGNSNVTNKELELAKTDVTTQEVTEKNLQASYTNTDGKVKVKNRTDYEITNELMTPDYNLENNKDIIIFHTHTCESYTPTEAYNYQMTGNYRTTDLNYTVAKVGDELTNQLQAYGYHVIHDKTYHDYPAYTGSYGRSLATVENILSQKPGIQSIIDLHRDAVGNGDDYGPTVKIGDETVAQLMFVLGTDSGGLLHPNWRQNFKYAVKIQQKANEMYPGLFRPINLTTSRYNQQVASGAVIIEVGATANTMEQCLGSMKYLAKVMSEVMK